MRTLANAELTILWLLWIYPYVFRAPKIQKRPSITSAGPSWAGFLLEVAGIFIVSWFRVPGGVRDSIAAMLAAVVLGALADVLMWTAVKSLGRQFRIQAGLYHDHQLVRSGPYSLVRHPIYASLLCMTLATGLLFAPWRWMAAGLSLFVAGTEIRLKAEERLLASRFGSDFAAYRKQVPAYIPFLR